MPQSNCNNCCLIINATRSCLSWWNTKGSLFTNFGRFYGIIDSSFFKVIAIFVTGNRIILWKELVANLHLLVPLNTQQYLLQIIHKPNNNWRSIFFRTGVVSMHILVKKRDLSSRNRFFNIDCFFLCWQTNCN